MVNLLLNNQEHYLINLYREGQMYHDGEGRPVESALSSILMQDLSPST